jgi:hypothetical protein
MDSIDRKMMRMEAGWMKAKKLAPSCVEIPLRRATSKMTTPSTMLSATIRSFTASGHDRRRSTPVITSTRLTRSGLVSPDYPGISAIRLAGEMIR